MNRIQQLFFFLTLFVIFCACSNDPKTVETETPPIPKTETKADDLTPKGETSLNPNKAQTLIPLCTINGEEWTYTRGIGTISESKSTGVKSVLFTFNSDINRETIQITYSYPEGELTEFLYNAKKTSKDGRANSLFAYSYNAYVQQDNPELTASGKLTITDDHIGSGKFSGDLKLLDFFKSNLPDNEKAVIKFKDGAFEGINFGPQLEI